MNNKPRVVLQPNVGLRLMKIHNLPNEESVARLLGVTPGDFREYLSGRAEPTSVLIAQVMASGLGAAEVITLADSVYSSQHTQKVVA